jgi:hypothetical protein
MSRNLALAIIVSLQLSIVACVDVQAPATSFGVETDADPAPEPVSDDPVLVDLFKSNSLWRAVATGAWVQMGFIEPYEGAQVAEVTLEPEGVFEVEQASDPIRVRAIAPGKTTLTVTLESGDWDYVDMAAKEPEGAIISYSGNWSLLPSGIPSWFLEDNGFVVAGGEAGIWLEVQRLDGSGFPLMGLGGADWQVSDPDLLAVVPSTMSDHALVKGLGAEGVAEVSVAGSAFEVPVGPGLEPLELQLWEDDEPVEALYLDSSIIACWFPLFDAAGRLVLSAPIDDCSVTVDDPELLDPTLLGAVPPCELLARGYLLLVAGAHGDTTLRIHYAGQDLVIPVIDVRY